MRSLRTIGSCGLTVVSEMKALKDEYLSAEHYLLALSDARVAAARLLKDAGITRSKLMAESKSYAGLMEGEMKVLPTEARQMAETKSVARCDLRT